MSHIIHEELIKLASEFAAVRQTPKKNRFPKTLWQQAILITQQLPLAEVCRALKIHPAYFRNKMASQASTDSEKAMTFVEIIPPKPNTIIIHIESSSGHKMSVEGLTTSNVASILSELLKGGSSCCK